MAKQEKLHVRLIENKQNFFQDLSKNQKSLNQKTPRNHC